MFSVNQTSTGSSNKTTVRLLTVICICLVILVLIVLDNKFNFITSSEKSDHKYAYTAGVFTQEDLEIYDTKSKEKVYLGMNQKDAEEILGKPVQEEGLVRNMFEYTGGISVYYRIDRVAAIQIESSNRFVTTRNISSNSENADITLAYGKPIPGNINQFIDYLFLRKGQDSFEKLNSYEGNGNELTSEFLLSFGRDNNRILLCDMQFAKMLS